MNKKLYYLALLGGLVTTHSLCSKHNKANIVQALYEKYHLSPQDQDEEYTKMLLRKYHLAPHQSPFTYEYVTEIYNDLLEESQQLNATFENIAIEQHSHLNDSFFFKDLKILGVPHKVRQYQLQKKKRSRDHGELLQAKTTDGQMIHGTLLRRNSKTLLVVGAGFTNYREQMAPFGDMFTKYDVLFFDFRGHGYEEENPLLPTTWKSFSKKLLGIDRKKARLGLCEEQDVKAIVEHTKSKYEYNQVIGLGICYSTCIFVKTAALYPQIFDKLILDGCWLSLHHATEILARDPGMIARPQRHSSLANNWLIKQKWFRSMLLNFAQRFLNIEFNTVSILDYAPKLPNIPILFIHGKDDVLIPRNQFEVIWHATLIPRKTAIITSNEHVWNHLKQKEAYKEWCELFVDNTHENFTMLLTSPEALIAYKSHQIERQFRR